MNDLSGKKQLADAAKELIDNPAFKHAILELRKRWFDQLMTAAPTAEAKVELVAQMKALEAIPAELTVLINDFKMAMSRQPKHA
jgi:hypothetical protein